MMGGEEERKEKESSREEGESREQSFRLFRVVVGGFGFLFIQVRSWREKRGGEIVRVFGSFFSFIFLSLDFFFYFLQEVFVSFCCYMWRSLYVRVGMELVEIQEEGYTFVRVGGFQVCYVIFRAWVFLFVSWSDGSICFRGL